jgi:hypothetical protein
VVNENLDRLRHGWQPRKDARWYWHVLADLIMLVGMVRRRVRRRRK